ncbi:MAG: type II toxin-antitoxin system HicB family antitoxin [Nitrococcus sp.]|nr:type II toxin-antitoxin system HicB family antitoxin [Nitrococcus sp.]
MSTMSIRLPNSLHRRLREYAEKEGVSINQFITSATLEKLASISTQDYLETSGARGSRKKFEDAMAQVPDTDPDPMER